MTSLPPVPTTSIYSRSDGVAVRQASLHDKTWVLGRLQDTEISGSRIGMDGNCKVMANIADRLAQPDDGRQRSSPST